MRPRTRVAIVALGVVALLAAGECAVRAFRPLNFLHPVARDQNDPWRTEVHQRSAIAGLDYELRPGVVSTNRDIPIVVNAAGMRGPEIREPRPPRSTRVLVLGDSVSFGLGVEEPATWPRDLERRLRAARPELDAEVLNLSVSGYGTLDEALVLEARIDALAPDLVLVGYCLNDPEQAPIQGLRSYFHEPAFWHHSALARLVASTRRERSIAASGDVVRWLHDPHGESWPVVRDSLARIARACAAHGVPALVVVFPMFGPHDLWTSYAWTGVHEFVVAESRAQGLAALDLLPTYAGSGRTPVELRLDESHANVEGHAIAAEAIAARLLADPALGLALPR